MPAHVSRRRSLLVTAAALACGPLLVMPAAHATSPYAAQSRLVIGTGGSPTPPAGCTASDGTGTTTTKSLAANGPVQWGSAAQTVTTTNDNDAGDTVSSTSSATVRGWLRASGSNPTSIDLTASGASGSTSSRATSACTATSYAGGMLTTEFTLHHATIATIDASGSGTGDYMWMVAPAAAGGANPLGLSAPSSALMSGSAQSITSHTVMYLPAGTYAASATGLVANQEDRTTSLRRGTARVHIALAAAGSRTAAARSAYVLMPASRSCSTHRVIPKITTSKKLLKKIKSIVFQVNGHTVKKLTHPKRGALVKLAAPDSLPITVTAKVKLRTGKTATSSASYLQCS